jgi:steroid delta-isomerase-like uncharacterized protein
MSAHNERVLDELVEAWCFHDIPALLNLFTDDCLYEDMAMGVVNRGKAELQHFAEEVFKTMPNFHLKFPQRFATQEYGASEWVITATWAGPFEGVDCSGRNIVFTGLSMYTFRDGKLASNRDCWDYTSMMRQFGVLGASLRSLR